MQDNRDTTDRQKRAARNRVALSLFYVIGYSVQNRPAIRADPEPPVPLPDSRGCGCDLDRVSRSDVVEIGDVANAEPGGEVVPANQPDARIPADAWRVRRQFDVVNGKPVRMVPVR